MLIYFDTTVAFRITVATALSQQHIHRGGYIPETLTGQNRQASRELHRHVCGNGNTVTFTETTGINTNCGGVYTGTWEARTSYVAFDASFQQCSGKTVWGSGVAEVRYSAAHAIWPRRQLALLEGDTVLGENRGVTPDDSAGSAANRGTVAIGPYAIAIQRRDFDLVLDTTTYTAWMRALRPASADASADTLHQHWTVYLVREGTADHSARRVMKAADGRACERVRGLRQWSYGAWKRDAEDESPRHSRDLVPGDNSRLQWLRPSAITTDGSQAYVARLRDGGAILIPMNGTSASTCVCR